MKMVIFKSLKYIKTDRQTDRHAYIKQQELMDKKEVQWEALEKAESRGMKAKRQTQPCKSFGACYSVTVEA